MKNLKNTVIGICVAVFLCVGYAHVEAQQNIAQEAYAILETNCATCHDATGYAKDTLLLERDALVNTGVVKPGNPLESEFYKRLLGATEKGPQMPLGLPPLSDEASNTIFRWIEMGAPDWDVPPPVDFITPDAMLDTIASHLEGLDPFDRTSARYFTLTHLYNSGEPPETLRDYRIALSKLVNSLSWGFEVTNPTPVDALGTIFYIDLRHYEWDRTNAWGQIESAYPYNPAFDPQTQASLLEKMTALRVETDSLAPFVDVDWFLATASLPPLYNDILGLPQTTLELERQLEVNAAVNIRSAPGVRVWRAGFNDSGVSNHNRIVERHTARYGAYWKSYDFAGSAGSQNIFTHPLNFTYDGGEMIFNLPNGLQAYYLADAVGNRLDVAPTTIVSNPAASDPAVRNGLSCIGCHTEGMKDFTDSVRAAIDENQNPPYDKVQALRLYPPQSVLDDLLQTDTERFQTALAKIAEPFASDDERNQFFERHQNEPVQRFHEAFQAPLDLSYAAAAVGLQTSAFLTQISEKQSLKNLGLAPLVEENGTVKRDAWTGNFHDVRAALFNPEYVAPETEGPIRPVGDFYIPDVNLHAVIAEHLGKAADAEITAAEMLTLRRIIADDRAIRDLTGLEFATQLERIELRRNMITDLSPLAGLTQLNNIKLRGNQITDVAPLAKLIRVDWLGLEQNRIIDLSPLSELTRLQGIGISGNPVVDVAPLAKLTSLERIDAWQTPIEDFSPLAALRVLRWIEYGNDKSTTALPSLTGLKALRRLEIHGCGISDISALAELTQLRWLELVNNAITDLLPLENLTNLTHLNLDANLISDVSPLSGLSNLNLLYLENNVISNVSPLSELTNLQRLDLRNNAISDFSPLEDLEGVAIRMTGNPGFPTNGGPHITGPWLWAIVPGTRLDTRTDFLSRATNGAATEIKVATNGAKAGKAVGKSAWTWHSLGTGGNNINRMTEALGWGTGSEIYDHIVYGAVILDSPQEQQTTMFVGHDDALKVWLNGELVHTALNINPDHYASFFPVTLKQGKNVLLVAIDNHGHGGFSGFFGLARDAEYAVFMPSPRFVLSTEATEFEIEDTFTLELRVENMENLGGWQADLVFNPAVLNAVEVSEGDFLQESDEKTYFDAGTIQNSIGKITGLQALRLSGGSVDGNGVLCSVTFTVVGTGECRLTLENFEAGTATGSSVPSIPPELRIVVEGDEPEIPAWDVNMDGQTDFNDILLVVTAIVLEQTPADNLRADVNGDGVIDQEDFEIVTQHLGEPNASAAPQNVVLPTGVTHDIVAQALDILRAMDNTTPAIKQSIVILENILATFVPEKTVLLPNYPNPFNPETWIPYHLAKPAPVTLTIYGANGTVVRTLALGHQPAGIYQTRSRAAYWDGKNDVGEPVASGVYFITLTANNFTTTRKMLLMK